MDVSWRIATTADITRIAEMYVPAAQEQAELREAWPLADGLAEPASAALERILADDDSMLVVGLIDDVVFGFGWAIVEGMLPQAGGEKVGVIKLIYVEDEARTVGVGEAMLAGLMKWFADRKLRRFDAIVSPGHRLAKNFFESAGFKARRITMYRRDG